VELGKDAFGHVRGRIFNDGKLRRSQSIAFHELPTSERDQRTQSQAKRNVILSDQSSGQGIVRRPLDLTNLVPQPLHKYLQTIVLIDSGAPEWVPELEAACRFCRSNPQILVKYHQRKAQFSGITFLFHPVSIRHIVRREASFV
jgi:hypothetical protein